MQYKQKQSGGVSLLSLLGVAFVVLKLCGVIDWSWWWVTAPLWGPVAVLLTISVVCFALAGVLRAGEWVANKFANDSNRN